MDLAIGVKDAAGSYIGGAEVTILLPGGERRSGTTDGRGQILLSPLPSADFQLKVVHAMYVEEDVHVIPPEGGGQFLWDNPVWTFTPPSSVVVRLSRIRAAALAPMSDEEMKRRASYNPQGAFTWVDHAGNPTHRYLGLYNSDNSFVPLSHPLLPEKPAEGWERFNHGEPVKLDPSRSGNFFWLEWGGRQQPQAPRRRMGPALAHDAKQARLHDLLHAEHV
ncbi:carboxypeptidase-like regulatory domain-containing protein [Paenibacillus mendelii]|uniref:Carboxypeptidase-like regulatory domain-containing protein n=1 Tax=Paenibacillus mendelii TaxID=206163 RepID=A0ABV6J236_9BACL|nr:carboxypeptidase-like regulatory domain-containing protein [Paenibacillus mendelii]MCQ6562875.1 carboxypeptidase-like regulatory domain-containing protein [Paenibacillus mendelii]